MAGGVQVMATVSFERNVVINDSKKIAEIKSALEKEPVIITVKNEQASEENKRQVIKKWFCR